MNSIATRVWIGTALLHRENPRRHSFDRAEIRARCATLPGPHPEERSVHAHLTQHVIANYKPSSNRKRYLYREMDRSLRLYRPGDPFSEGRESGAECPREEELPEEYRHLHDWYWSEYAAGKPAAPAQDAMRALRGAGKEHWDRLGGTKFIDDLRRDWQGAMREDRLAEPRPRWIDRIAGRAK